MLTKTLIGFFLSVFQLSVSGCQGSDLILSKDHPSGKATQTLEAAYIKVRNRLMGCYELKGENLTFGRMASTRMAC